MNLTGQKPRQKWKAPLRSEKHRRFVASLPCVVCKVSNLTQAAHIRIGWYRGGEKPGDDRVTPLCLGCHFDQHSMNETFWWKSKAIDPFQVARDLYAISGDETKGKLVVYAAGRKAKFS